MRQPIHFSTALGLLLLIPIAALGQISFEVASFKLADPKIPYRACDITGGPGTNAPGQIMYSTCPLNTLIREAYGVALDQISIPSAPQDLKYTIVAKVPSGSTKDQIPSMLRNLLKERLGPVIRRENKEFAAYELHIAKGGAKLRAAEKPEAEAERIRPGGALPIKDRDGYPILAGGRGISSTYQSGSLFTTYRGISVAEFIHSIRRELGSSTGSNNWSPARVVDKTGLSGKYDFHLQYATTGATGGALSTPASPSPAGTDNLGIATDPAGPSLFTALEKQLGLKLDRKILSLEVLVIERIEKTPLGN